MAETHQCCTFFLNQLFLGIEVEKVREILSYQEMTPVPLAPREVKGLINLRGEIVTAIDLRARLEMPQRSTEALPLNIIVQSDKETVSLLVDEIGDVLEVSEDDFELPPDTLTGPVRQLLRGTYKLEKQLLLILDVDKTISAPIL